MKLGLIEGRHAMPVDGYLLPATVTDDYGFGQELYDAAAQAVRDCYHNRPNGFAIELYITGLSVALLGAVVALKEFHQAPAVFSYNTATQNYDRIVLN